MPITAEGVENIAQFDQAAAEGCDEVQGFFLSKPVSAPQVSSVIRKFERRRGTSRSSRKLGKLTTASGFSR
jgi:EAL domain-containing protein (putative c-di-GMP-specific phosphodiesterase class I)